MTRPHKPPIVHKLEQRRAWQPDYRDRGLGDMLTGAVVMVALGIAALAIWGGP